MKAIEREMVFLFVTTLLGFSSVVYGDIAEVNNRLIEVVTRDQVGTVIEKTQHVVLFFTNRSSHETKRAEAELLKIKTDLQTNLHVNILKIEDSVFFAKENGLEDLPGLLYYRNGQPVLYDGSIQEDELYEWLQHNMQSSVYHLGDDSFEHLTQASTGATTGDWFVLFCNVSDISCHSLRSIWESLAIRCKGRLNVAIVDIQNSPELNERFLIKESPTLKFFHHGKMYDYSVNKYTVMSLSRFAFGWYKNIKYDKVPGQKTPFDYLIERIVKKIQHEFKDPYAVPSIVMLLLPCTIVLAAVLAFGREYKLKNE